MARFVREAAPRRLEVWQGLGPGQQLHGGGGNWGLAFPSSYWLNKTSKGVRHAHSHGLGWAAPSHKSNRTALCLTSVTVPHMPHISDCASHASHQ